MHNSQILFIFVLLFVACQTNHTMDKQSTYITEKVQKMSAPDVEKRPKELTTHGHTRIDNYYWLNQREDENVISYLRAENAYLDSAMAHTKEFQEELYHEIVGRIKQDDESVPYFKNGYYYITRFEEGKEYPIYSRKHKNMEADEEIMIDVNQLAEQYSYYQVTGTEVSPNNEILAFGEDTLSRRIYTVRFKNLKTGEWLDDEIQNTEGYVVWANDNEHVYYARKDETLRPYKIFKHKMGTPSSADVEVWHEEDPTFNSYVWKTKSNKFIVIGSYSTLTNSFQLLPADDPTRDFVQFSPRQRGLEYHIYHSDDKFYVLTNLDAKNFRLMQTPDNKTSVEHWEEVIAHRDDVLLEDVDVFQDYLLLHERIKGIGNLRVIPNEGEEHYIDFGEDAYLAYTTQNYEMNTESVRIEYTSLKTPWTTYDYNMRTQELTLRKQQEVVGGYEVDDYVTERLYVPSRDGVDIPVSLVYKKGVKKSQETPLLLYAYGSYGSSMDPYFSSVRLSLLDRGFVYAIAHIRGGQELGRDWYEDGKLLKKKNTFNDFVDCAKYLVSESYTSPDHLYAMGGSAGGLLMGAVVNQAPDLFHGVIAAVPFVDVVTTMLDESIPLTTGEFDEWGNPKVKEYYDYILSYSPYDQVKEQSYPSMLVTTGLHDSQVQYWEPAKWVAKLRDMKTDDHPLLLYTNLETGHSGASGRFQRHKETAMEYAFLLDLEGLGEY